MDQGVGSITSGATPSISPSSTTVYTLTVTNAAGRSVTSALTVVVELSPNAAISAPAVLTGGQRGYEAFVPNAVAGQNYYWEIVNGTITAGGSTPNVVFQAGTSGSPANLSCNVTSADRLLGSKGTVNIPIVAPPSATITTPVCAVAGTVGLMASVPVVPGCSYAWSVQGATITTGGSSSLVVFDAPATPTGPINMTCVVTNSAGSSVTGYASIDAQSQVGDATGVYVINYAPTTGTMYQIMIVQDGDQIYGWGTLIPGLSLIPPAATSELQTNNTNLKTANMEVSNEQKISLPWSFSGSDLYSISGIILNGVIQGTAWDFAGGQLMYFTWTVSSDGSSVQVAPGYTFNRLPGEVGVVFQSSRLLLGVNGALQMTPTVIGTGNKQVTWEIQGAPGESISSTGSYIAPSLPGLYAVTARSVADSNQSATTIVRVTATGALDLGAGTGTNNAATRIFQSGTQLIVDYQPYQDLFYRFNGTVSGLSYNATWKSESGATGVFNGLYEPLGLGFTGQGQSSSLGSPVGFSLGSFIRFGGTTTNFQVNGPLLLNFQIHDDSTTWNPRSSYDLSRPSSIWKASYGVVHPISAEYASYAPPLKPRVNLVTAAFGSHPSLVQGAVCVNLVPRGIRNYPGVYQTSAGEFSLWSDGTFRWINPALGAVATGRTNSQNSPPYLTLDGNWTAGSTSGTLELVFDALCGSFQGYWQIGNGDQQEWQGTLIPGTIRVALSAPTSVLNTGGGTWVTPKVTGVGDPGLSWSATGGSVSANGFYLAPINPGSYVVTATSIIDSAQSASRTFQVIDHPFSTNFSGAFGVGGSPSLVLFQDGFDVRALTYYNDPTGKGYFTLNGDLLEDLQGNIYQVSPDGNSLTFNPANSGTLLTRSTQSPAVIAMTPEYVSLSPGQSFQFKLLSAGGTPSVSATYGAIDATGFYTAPAFPIRDKIILNIPGGYPACSVMVDVVGSAPVSAQGTYLSAGTAIETMTITGSGNTFSATLANDTFGFPLVITGTVNANIWTGIWFVAGDALRQGAFTGYFDPTADSVQLFFYNPTGPVGLPMTLNRASGSPSIFLSPNSATVALGGSVQFTWTPAAGKSISSVNWSILEANGGTIDVFGNYTAPFTPGTYTVVARSSSNSGLYGQTVVTVQPEITILLSNITMPTGSSQKFGYTLLAPTNRVSWSVTGGTITSDGTYTAPLVPGYYTVTVTGVDDPTATASAVVTVVYPTITLTITPMPNLYPGQTFQMGYQCSSGDVTWRASAGTFSGSIYTAPTAAGTYTLTATSILNPTVSASVQAAVLKPQILIAPNRALVAPNATYQFQSAVTGGSLLWSVVEPTGGTISNTGLYTAPTVVGTYTVKALSSLDSTVFTTATVVVGSGGSGGGSGGGAPSPVNGGVEVIPALVTAKAGTYQAFSATVSVIDDQAVTWRVAGNPTTAKVDAQGVFTASRQGRYQVVATSVANGTSWGSATILVTSSVDPLNDKMPESLNRRNYSVTVLPTGKVLFAGGWDGSAYRSDCYLYDPSTQTFTPTGALVETKYTVTDAQEQSVSMTVSAGRSGHTATLLQDGHVLIANGIGFWTNDSSQGTPAAQWLPFAQIFDSATGTFQPLPSRPDLPAVPGYVGPYAYHSYGTGVAMSNGQALIVGGDSGINRYSLESVFDGTSKTFSDIYIGSKGIGLPDPLHPGQGMGIGESPVAVPLDDGRVLIAGGWVSTLPTPPALDTNYDDSATIYDSKTGFAALGKMTSKRAEATATKLADGRVLIAGGAAQAEAHVLGSDYHAPAATAEIFDPKINTFTAVASMNNPRCGHAAILLPTGQVLVVGGYTSQVVAADGTSVLSYPTETELYDPDSNTWSVMDHLDYGLSEPKLALLPDGTVFVAGQIQAPMEAPQTNPLMMSALKAASFTTATMTQGSGLMGILHYPIERAAYPEEAALLNNTTADLDQRNLPRRAVISMPLPVDADTTSGSQNLWLGTNQRYRYFLIKYTKPLFGPDFQVSGIQVTVEAGSGADAQKVILMGSVAPQPLAPGIFEAIQTKDWITYAEGDATTADLAAIAQRLSDPTLRSSVTDTEKEIYAEHKRKAWTQAWLPANPPAAGATLLYYRVGLTNWWEHSTLQYGLKSGAIFSPPAGNLRFTFRLYQTLNGQPAGWTDIPVSTTVAVEPLWSVAQFYRNYFYSDWNNDKWANKATFDWMADWSRKGLLEPVNDITLEHGRNTGHMEHRNGNQADTYHPGYGVFISSTSQSTGTNFTSTYLVPTHQRAAGWTVKDSTGKVLQTVAPDSSALTTLSQWVSQARSRIQGYMANDNVGTNAPISYRYLTSADQVEVNANRNNGEAYVKMMISCSLIRDLMLNGNCNGLIYTDDITGNTTTYGAINLTTQLGAWDVNTNISVIIPDATATHTNHMHVNWGRKSQAFLKNGTNQ